MLIALVGLSIALAGCSIPDRGPVVPYTYTELAQPHAQAAGTSEFKYKLMG